MEARRLRDSGRIPDAARLLEAYVHAHPTDPIAAGLLGETRYWLKDVAGARAAYEEGLGAAPRDIALKLAYARMLIETSAGGRALQLLEPLRLTGETHGRAEEMLGTLAYWSGDYVTATRRFNEALSLDPGREDARRSLREILIVTAPWVRVGGDVQHDDQPLDRVTGDAQAGWFITPLVSLAGRVQPMRLRDGTGLTRTMLLGDAALAAYLPATRLEIELAAGGIERANASTDWTGHAGFGARLTPRLIVHARAERAPYLFTVASMFTPIMTTTLGASVDWSHSRGWLGQAAATRTTFPDRNAVTGAYAWLLAPLVNADRSSVQLGYSLTAQTSDETRFEPSGVPVSPRNGDPVKGTYDPYHTPVNLLAHSAIAALATRPSSRVELRFNGAVGVSAHEEILVWRTAGGPRPGAPSIVFAEREFRPWTIRGSIRAQVATRMHLLTEFEYSRTAFYGAGAARVSLTKSFPTAALRRLEQR